MLVVAAAFGAATGLAGRIVYLAGLYEAAAALALGALAVAVCHLLALAPGRGAVLLAGMAAATWLACHEVADAWATWQDQARWLRSEPVAMAQDLAVAQVDRPEELVDLGLRAETGQAGLVGSWLMQHRRGPMMLRTLSAQRALPGGLVAVALALAVRATLVGLAVWRALQRLANEPRCGRCGRYLSRKEIGRVDDAQLRQLVVAWAAGVSERPPPDGHAGAYRVLLDQCPRGHHVRPGLSAVLLRGHGWSAATPGIVAALPPVLAAGPPSGQGS